MLSKSNYYFIILILLIFCVLQRVSSRSSIVDTKPLSSWLLISIIFLYSIYNSYRKNTPSTIILVILACIYGTSLFTILYFFSSCIQLYFSSKPNTLLFTKISNEIFKENILKSNFDDIPKYPTIWVSNYPLSNMIEYFSQGLLPQTYVLITGSSSKMFVSKVYDKNRVIIVNLDKKSNYKELKDKIKEKIDQGMNIFCYFDTKMIPKHKRKRFSLMGIRNGIFNIAKELNIEITPIVMDHLYISNGVIPRQKFEIVVKPSVKINNDEDIDGVIRIFRKSLKKLLSDKFKV